MGTSGKSEEIIILSDDEDDKDTSCLIVEVEAVKKTVGVLPVSPQDEDLVVTFSRRPDVLPHARYDCPIHPFMTAPMANNQLICDQCFCYVCDKLASLCGMWCCSGECHCNSHNKSDFWNGVRNTALLGELQRFNLTLSEVDHRLRNADFTGDLLEKVEKLQMTLYHLKTHNKLTYSCFFFFVFLRYGPVVECVTQFLNKADKQNSRAAAIMQLGAAEEFMRHFQFKSFIFGCNSSSVCCSLTIRPWQDVLLVSVLKGQNVSGFRKDKGKKDVLLETISVVLLRTELLQLQSRYRELCRYLRVVLTDNVTLYQHIQDLIPFFKCKLGEFGSALESLFPPVNPPASRFTPAIFLLYLRIFETATAPRLTVSQLEQLCFSEASWEPIKGQKRIIVCFCPQTYPDQALLLLVTGALGVRILQGSFSPALPVLSAYKVMSPHMKAMCACCC
uniref:Uncharacterized protein n=1 Tax=Poecilia reticulata TaxID=8081 RepID=A0A3P9MRV1_POERE